MSKKQSAFYLCISLWDFLSNGGYYFTLIIYIIPVFLIKYNYILVTVILLFRKTKTPPAYPIGVMQAAKEERMKKLILIPNRSIDKADR